MILIHVYAYQQAWKEYQQAWKLYWEHLIKISSFVPTIQRAMGRSFVLGLNKNIQGGGGIYVDRYLGSLQDLVVVGAGTVYWNCPYCIEFIDDSLQLPVDNIFQENILSFFSCLKLFPWLVYALSCTFKYDAQYYGLEEKIIFWQSMVGLFREWGVLLILFITTWSLLLGMEHWY